jgi:transposase
MEVMYPRCAGLDVHKETVVACVGIVEGGEVSRLVRTFATTTASLIELGEWLEANSCTQVGMEATGVYWKPVWQVLSDGSFTLVLANAAQVKNVPGRKTDVNDATWLAELLAHGLVRASFVPEAPIQELRGLLRTRKQLVREKASHVQRLQKTLEEANIKLESVLSDVMGRSGRAMIEALIEGESDPAKLAALAHCKVRASTASLREALRGRVKRHHRFLLRLHLQQIDALDAAVADIDRELRDAGASSAACRRFRHCAGTGRPSRAGGRRWRTGSCSVPISDTITWALSALTPGIVINRSTASRKQASEASSSMAQGHARAMRLGINPQERELPASAVPAAACAARSQEGRSAPLPPPSSPPSITCSRQHFWQPPHDQSVLYRRADLLSLGTSHLRRVPSDAVPLLCSELCAEQTVLWWRRKA